MADLLEWVQSWFLRHCDESWEHEYGVTIETLDNPGWLLKVDLKRTELEQVPFVARQRDEGSEDWYSLKVEDGQFRGAGDALKLPFLLNAFREWAMGERR